MQSTNTIFLVRPARFGFNLETAASNYFQQAIADLDAATLQALAFAEFDAMVDKLRAKGVNVLVFDDTPEPVKPDAVFPNNWLTLHPDGRAVLYPMCAPNRRAERRLDILEALRRQFIVTEIIDLSSSEQAGRFLEGTGSILFDHEHRIAYACLSPRTDARLFADVAAQLGYRPVSFRAHDAHSQEIYHTNVMLSIGAGFAVVCLESIVDAAERANIVASLTATGHEIVDISLAQVAHFAGNLLALQPSNGPAQLAMSQSAFDAFTPAQHGTLRKYCELLPLPIPTIETIGGGSVRCMLTEVFLPAIP
ncbi:citrulline utilization hydrolase CtlX [uncultured Hymenobacter sp.]|uniref:citrulline utilization hydrolase CtlX n=1 Tax=uncultured Hymenobacter sp. TaxID=170016 RepID=UPI0035CB474F